MRATWRTAGLAAGLVLALGVSGSASAQRPLATTGLRPEGVRPRIDVCFVLDTTGSMSGLIEGAKAKIWSIANQMIAARPTPLLRIALIPYRDRGDEYVTKVFDLTDDIDTVYAKLQELSAGGGGDGPESVNQALWEAVNRISWSPSRNVLKIVFLVGDAPPHMDYSNDVPYQQACQAAVKKDLIVNTIQCGTDGATTEVWNEIARLSEGRYASLGQAGDMRIVSTPMDEELSRLNASIGKTIVTYGSKAQKDGVMAKQALAFAAPASVAADRLAYNAATGKVVQGGGDLVDDTKAGRASLSGLKKEDLPEELRDKTPDQQKAYLKEQEETRRKLQARVGELVKQRQVYIDAEMKKAKAGFDVEVASTLKEQAKRKKITFGTE